jgi:molybdopterin molybdotransferase
MLPLGSDAVVMREDATVEGDFVEMAEPVQPWENVRFRGEDVRSGAELAKRGDRLTPQRMALLGTAGISQVETYGIPKVAFVSTGSELRIPGESLGPGQIYESNSLALAELARTAGAEPIRHRPAVDSAEAIRRAFEIAFEESDTVVSIGGASVGDLDLVRPVLKQMGGEIDFWRLAIRPGKPFFFGHCGGKPVLGVPGNPVSAFVTTVLLVLPALRALAGWDYADCPPPVSAGVLAEPLSNRDGRRHFMRVVVDRTGQVRSAGAQASHLLSSLACADGLADVPPDTELAEGSAVKVLGWRV